MAIYEVYQKSGSICIFSYKRFNIYSFYLRSKIASKLSIENQIQSTHKSCKSPRQSIWVFVVISVFQQITACGSRLTDIMYFKSGPTKVTFRYDDSAPSITTSHLQGLNFSLKLSLLSLCSFCSSSVCVHMGSPWVLQFPLTFEKHVCRWTDSTKLPRGNNDECVNEYTCT